MRPFALAAVLSLACFLAPSAQAAQSYDNCTNTITSLPTIISTQGVWCMKGDLSTALASGNAITINVNNVTIDCNGFKLGGLLGGAAATTIAIRGDNRLNVRVRNCQVRGFYYGLLLLGGTGHIIEDNQFDGSRSNGILVSADASMIRRNLVIDTGGAASGMETYGISVIGSTHVVDNTVDGVVPSGGDHSAYGIFANDRTSVVGNRVDGVLPSGNGSANGIYINGFYALVKDNYVYGSGAATDAGIYCTSDTTTARDNTVSESADGIVGCYSLDNVVQP